MASTVWRGYITFGLISIPVRLFRAARAERVSLRRLYRSESRVPEIPARGRTREAAETAHFEPDLAPVRQAAVRKETGEVLPEQSVVKGYEYEKNRFVALEPEELKSLAPQTSTAMEIAEFVKLSEIDPVYFETSYYVHPDEAGEKAYGLLYRAMSSTGLAAIAQFAMHTREHVVVLRPGRKGILGHTMFYENEVRADEEFRADTTTVSEKELKLAETLIHSLAGPFEPASYRDTYRERLEAMLAKKVPGQPVEMPQRAQRPAEVVDIAEALRKSLANLKKPAASEEQAREAAKRSGSSSKRASRGAGGK
jgi:DNA end-binding protein Ku